METMRRGGLSGKARRIRTRNRAARLCAQSVIDEYFHPDPEEVRRDRPIPIRSRREFLPTVLHHADSRPAGTTETRRDGQLELGLGAGGGRGDERRAGGSAVSQPITMKTRTAGGAIRFQAAAPSSLSQPLHRVPFPAEDRFDPRRFLVGLGAGSAAAAAALLLLSLVAG